MKDGLGREIDYLRISLTDKCNLRCGYCMPREGIRHLAHSEILTLEEAERIACIMSGVGIKRIRLTGGEPLVRKGVAGFIRMLINDCGIKEVAMTSNGSLLAEHASSLKEAGLARMNISLDTLDRSTFLRLTGKDELENVLKGIELSVKTGFHVRLNCVPLKGINDTEILSLAEYAGKLGIGIRFIELMPLGCGRYYEGIPAEKLMESFEKAYGRAHRVDPEEEADCRGPAKYYSFEGYTGRIGFISPMTHKFCDSCSRIRLTAEGFLKLCLQYPDGADLKGPLRIGMSDDDIREIIMKAVQKKPACHTFNLDGAVEDKRRMVEIGG